MQYIATKCSIDSKLHDLRLDLLRAPGRFERARSHFICELSLNTENSQLILGIDAFSLYLLQGDSDEA